MESELLPETSCEPEIVQFVLDRAGEGMSALKITRLPEFIKMLKMMYMKKTEIAKMFADYALLLANQAKGYKKVDLIDFLEGVSKSHEEDIP